MSGFLRSVKGDLMRLSQGDDCSKLSLWTKIIHPRYLPVLLIRLSQVFYKKKFIHPLSYFFSFLNVILFGLEVTPRCKIAPGLLLPHTFGTVIGAAEIGCNVTIFQGVTLGAKYSDLEFNRSSRPILEDGVIIGAGAKVLGGIRIGHKAVVGAISLVTESVPDRGVAIGVPAIIKVKK